MKPFLNVYRFDPTTSEVCTYSYPDADGDSAYLVWYAGSVWLGDDGGRSHYQTRPIGQCLYDMAIGGPAPTLRDWR